MHGLQLPRPSPTSSLPPLASTSQQPASPPPTTISTPLRPPPNFASARAKARIMRGEAKSPFVPKRSPGKERDLSQCSIEQLTDMLERNTKLLDSPATFANLPGGDARLRSQQARIESRLRELRDVQDLRSNLDATHIHDVKEEDDPDEGKMEGVMEEGPPAAEEANSPRTKQRLAAQLLSQSPHSLTTSMSLAESLALQRRAVARDREAAERRAQQMELDAQRPDKVGGLLRGALGGDSALGGFMFQTESDDELDEDAIDDWLNEGKTGANGELNEEENETLNPLRTAYMEGWNRAAAEEG
ncbi:hypothetical protein JCM1840_002352 [Sporobolomyces johnsonii]